MDTKTSHFKTKKKFLGFVTSLNNGVRINQKSAFIDSNLFTQAFDNVKLKFTITEEGVNVEEIDSNIFSEETLQRFVDEICEKEVIGYAEKFVIKTLKFYTDEVSTCYLEVEQQKPIDKLFSLFDEIKETTKIVSEKGKSILDSLFQDKGEVIEVEIEDTTTKDSVEKPVVKSYIEESFEKMRQEKIVELKDRIQKKENEINGIKFDIKNSESKLNKCIDEVEVLNSRLNSFEEKDPQNGIVFNVSQEMKTGIEPDSKLVEVVEKISPILKLNKDVVIDMLTKGFYLIKFADKEDLSNEKFELGIKYFQKIVSMDHKGTFTIESPTEIKYTGDLTWHKLVDKLLSKGFEQSSEFDKMCGSNSYESEQ